MHVTRRPATCYAAWHSSKLSTTADSERFTWRVQQTPMLTTYPATGEITSFRVGLRHLLSPRRSPQNWWPSSASKHRIGRHLTGGRPSALSGSESGGVYHENLQGGMEEIPGLLSLICPQPQTNYLREGHVVHRLCRNSGSGRINHRGVPCGPQIFSSPG